MAFFLFRSMRLCVLRESQLLCVYVVFFSSFVTVIVVVVSNWRPIVFCFRFVLFHEPMSDEKWLKKKNLIENE